MSKIWNLFVVAGSMAVFQPALLADATAEVKAVSAVEDVQKSVPSFSWNEDFAAAQEQAKKENKLLLVDFTGSDWCGWCIKLDKEIFSQKAFQEAVVKKFVPVKIDFPQKVKQSKELIAQNEALAEKYSVEGFPTVMVMTPEGKVLYTTGYESVSPEEYVKRLEEGVAKNTKIAKPVVSGFKWYQNFDAAKQLAKKENKLLFVDFTGSDWCRWCIALDEQILSQKAFQEYAVKKFVMLKVDFPRKNKLSREQEKHNRELLKEYGVTGFPTILIMNAEGEVLFQTGYQDLSPEKYITHLEEGIAAAQKEKK